jgi:two-component system, NtrC family, sensor kinase
MKFLFFSFMLVKLMTSIVNGQNTENKSAAYFMKTASHDSSGVNLLLNASNHISFFNPDSGLILAEKALDLARDIHFRKGETDALNTYGEAFHFLGDYPRALKMQFEALQINRDLHDSPGEAETLGLIGIVYSDLGQYRQALQYLMPAITIFQQLHGRYQGSFELSIIGDAYYFLDIQDSALYYQRKAYQAFSDDPSEPHLKSFILRNMGSEYAHIGKNDSALKFFNDAVLNSRLLNDRLNLSLTQNKIAELYESIHQYDTALHYAKIGFDNAQSIHSKKQALISSNLIAKLYKETRNVDSAFFYLSISVAMRDSLNGPEKIRQLQLLMLDEQQKQETILRQHEQFRNRIKYMALLSGLGIFLLLALILWRNNQHKKKSNILLQKEKQKAEQAYEDLKSAQAQLIQSEKMASLGELTAGIAHEIQNPLNFVNNFSEVNTELIDELTNELNTGNKEEAISIAKDIKENEEKINHHGKRADAIVKGMLQHSRSSTGVKEPTDINASADEYLRLSYHGMRAKDKSFNAIMNTDFDTNIGKINIIPQDIGRVLLNLFNNAFYAVNEKQKAESIKQNANYKPLVSIQTKKLNNRIEIIVSDNGNGIPQNIVDKIFQPFFTTKPTGEGTGLGLSLSYDIVKAHGGEIKAETKENEGTEFIIQLPDV